MNAPCKVPPSAPDFSSTSTGQNALLEWMETNHKALGPIFQSHAFGAHVYVITDPQHVEHVLRRNWQNYRLGRQAKRVRMLLGNGLVGSGGELWKRQRRMMQPAFHDKAIERLTGLIQERNEQLLNRWMGAAKKAQAVNVTRDISVAILDIILEIIFGNDCPRVAVQFSILSEEPERTLQFAQEFRALGQLVRNVIADRRQTGDDSADLLGIMLRARDRDTGEGMSNNQVVDEVLTLLVAGHETTTSTLNWAWYQVSQDMEVAAKLYAEVSGVSDLRQLLYARWIIEETMRMYPPGWFFSRLARNDDVLGDYFVPGRTEIFICPYVIQRRPDLWPDPDRFVPERFDPALVAERYPLAFLPFSAGPRKCIGEHLARWEMLIHMSMIARKLRLCYVGDAPEYDVGVNLRSKHDMWMVPQLV
jgi:cytochrome P450